MFGLTKKTFIGLSMDPIIQKNKCKCVSLNNQKHMIQPTLIDYHSFAVKLDRCVGSCSTLNDLSNKVCVPNKTENLNLSVFNVITGINDQKH